MSADTSLDAFSDEPAGSATLTCTLPSSNAGRKSAPMPRQLPDAEADQHPGQQQQSRRPPHAEADQEAGRPTSAPAAAGRRCGRASALDCGSR